MKENTRNERHDRDDDSLDHDPDRPKTTSEVIREVHGDPDMNLNELRNEDVEMSDNRNTGSGGALDVDQTQGMSWNPNDASAVRSGGTTDMDDQTAGGAGLNTGARKGLGSHLTPKRDVTGSDYDGQDSTS
ncbi:MAG: hypothetical protein M3342_17625 [Bacteroidota bacterium]|nr:hypothetical protein [Bacteroidota bacterium]